MTVVMPFNVESDAVIAFGEKSFRKSPKPTIQIYAQRLRQICRPWIFHVAESAAMLAIFQPAIYLISRRGSL